MAINTGSHPKALWPGIHAWFGSSYKENPTEYTEIFKVDTSEKNYEEDVMITGFGLAPVKNEGATYSYDSESQGFTKRYKHVAYGLGYIVTREELADNLYEKVSKQRSKRLAFSMRQTRETVGANILNRAFNSSYTGGDSVELLSTAHTTLSGNQANELSVAADLSEASLEDLLIIVADAKNDRGLKIALRGMKLIVPTAEQFEACRILNSTLRVGSANNDVNAIKNLGLLPEGYVVNHYLTDTDAWFVKTDAPNGLMWFDREAVEFKQDNDQDTDNAKAKSYMRFSTGWTDWRGMYGSPGS